MKIFTRLLLFSYPVGKNMLKYFDFKSVCEIFQTIFSTTYYLLSLFLSLKKNTRWKKKFKFPNTRQQPKNIKMKSCRAAEFSKFDNFSMERKAGRASIAGGCLDGSLTGVLGSENPLPYLILIEFFKDPSSSHGKNRSQFSPRI